MKLLTVLVLVTAVAALPEKPSKNFPKKYNAAVHDVKDTYSTYSHAPDEDLVLPASSPFLDALLPSSSYDKYFEHGARDAILPPEGSTYTGLTETAEGVEDLAPPPADTYSSHDGKTAGDMVPPPITQSQADPSSYLAYTGVVQEPLMVPELSSYAHMESHASGHEVLASLAAMAQVLPRTSSYAHYLAQEDEKDAENTPVTHLRPPSAQVSSAMIPTAYMKVPVDQPDLTDAQISAAQKAEVQVPSVFLEPPPQ